MDTLKLEKAQNIFTPGWESDEPLSDLNSYKALWDSGIEDSLDRYDPEIFYLKNMSIAVPGSSYDDNALVFRSTYAFKNTTGDYTSFFNYTFINPETLETITSVIWDRNPIDNSTDYYELGFCDGPTYSYQERWKMPHMYSMSYVNTGTGVYNATISVTPINELKNDTSTITWDVYNLTFSRRTTSYATRVPYEVVLSFNSTGDAVSLAILHRKMSVIGGVLSDEEEANNKAQFENEDDYGWYFDDQNEYRFYTDSRLNVFNIENQPVNTFTYESYLPAVTTGNNLNISMDQAGTNLGVVNRILPIKLDDTAGIAQTSIALVCTKDSVSVQTIDGFHCPCLDYIVETLNASAVGLTIPAQTHNGTDISMDVQGNMWTKFETFSDYSVDVRFDVDGDDITDIPIPGLHRSANLEDDIKDIEEKPVNGPFAIFTQSNVIQELYWSLPYYQSVRFIDDLNEDGIPDALIRYDSVAFISITQFTQKTSFELLMEDPNTSMLFFVGIGCLVGGVLLIALVFVKLKKSRIPLKSVNKKRQLLMLIMAIGLMFALFISLGSLITSASRTSQGTQIGTTPEAQSIAQLSSTSNIAMFIFVMMIPATAGVYLLLSPIAADGIVALNQIRYAKKSGLEATLKKKEMKDLEEKEGITYQILLIPPFGRREKGTVVLGRILGVLALGLAIGLNVFDYYWLIFQMNDKL